MKNWVELICAGCDNPFPKTAKDHASSLKKGQARFFCSTSCQVRTTNLERTLNIVGGVKSGRLVQLTCEECKTPFVKGANEVRRWNRRGRNKFFCSMSCVRTQRNRLHPVTSNLRRGGIKDGLSSYRWFMLRSRSRTKGINIDAQFLRDLWESQSGVCPLTGWELILPLDSSGFQTSYGARNASLDRIDNDLGYVKGNVRFVALIANLARARFSDADLLDFCRSVAEKCRV